MKHLQGTNMKRLIQFASIIAGWAAISMTAFAAGPYVEGKHYTRLADPVPVRQPSKIEVAEIFSYACGHCFSFEGLVQDWKKDLPEDVNFVRLHVKWDRSTENLARALYTAQALGVVEQVHPALFRTLHMERKRLQTQEQIADVVAKQGVDKEAFNKTFNSFGITSQVKQAESKIAGSGVASTPSLLVNGRYVINASRDVDHETMLDVADYLVQQIREDRGE